MSTNTNVIKKTKKYNTIQPINDKVPNWVFDSYSIDLINMTRCLSYEYVIHCIIKIAYPDYGSPCTYVQFTLYHEPSKDIIERKYFNLGSYGEDFSGIKGKNNIYKWIDKEINVILKDFCSRYKFYDAEPKIEKKVVPLENPVPYDAIYSNETSTLYQFETYNKKKFQCELKMSYYSTKIPSGDIIFQECLYLMINNEKINFRISVFPFYNSMQQENIDYIINSYIPHKIETDVQKIIKEKMIEEEKIKQEKIKQEQIMKRRREAEEEEEAYNNEIVSSYYESECWDDGQSITPRGRSGKHIGYTRDGREVNLDTGKYKFAKD